MYHTYYDCATGFFTYTNLHLADVPDELIEDASHFLDFARIWLDFGGAAQECGNDFGIFVSGLMIAVDLWKSGELRFEPKRWVAEAPPIQLTSILDKDCSRCRAVLDPSYFKLIVANPNRRREELRDIYG